MKVEIRIFLWIHDNYNFFNLNICSSSFPSCVHEYPCRYEGLQSTWKSKKCQQFLFSPFTYITSLLVRLEAWLLFPSLSLRYLKSRKVISFWTVFRDWSFWKYKMISYICKCLFRNIGWKVTYMTLYSRNIGL